MSGICVINKSSTSSNMESDQLQKCCDEKDSEIDPRKLSLNGQGISKLPKSVILDNFVSINLEGNVFCELPIEICSLRKLKALNVSNNKIKLLPSEVGNLCDLEILNCSENFLESLPSSLSMISKLLVLNASRNSIISIPEELKNLKRLEVVNLSYNKLKEVPIAIVIGSSFISHLDLSNNCLADFSKEPKCSASLKNLKVNNNNMVELPVWIRCLQGVEELCLGYNLFKCVPHHPLDDMMPLSSLSIARLSIKSCGLKNLPVSLKHMKNLIYLDVGNSQRRCDERTTNTIWDLSPSLCLSYLKELRLPYVGLPVLPEDLWTSLKELEILDLEGNAVVWLPDGLSSQNHLTKLILSSNRLALLPNEIGAVKSLRELRLDGNKLHELPESIGSIEKLTYLDLYDNELAEVPLSISNLQHLKFLDLEANQFSADVFLSKVSVGTLADYEMMRESLRTKLALQSSRCIGSKDPPLSSVSDANSGDKESETSSLDSEYEPGLQESIKNFSIAEEEDWDKSDGSDNFFDPQYSQSLKDSAARSQWHWARDNGRWEQPVDGDVFCPADIHPDLIPRPGKKEEPEANVGQFDDVDDESE